jgi:hypothetical protein
MATSAQRLALTVLLAVSSGCAGVARAAEGGRVMAIEITGIDPAPPLDGFRPFMVQYVLSNPGAAPLAIPDLDAVELRIRDAAGTFDERRTSKGLRSLSSEADRATAKERPPVPHPVNLAPGQRRSGLFPSMDRWPPLPPGRFTAVLRVPLGGGAAVESPPFSFQVKPRPAARIDAEAAHGTAPFTSTTLRQRVLWFGPPDGHLVLLETVYPGFLSVVADARLPGEQPPLLLGFWPRDTLLRRVAMEKTGGVRVLEARPSGPEPSGELDEVDLLPLAPGAHLAGLAYVEGDGYLLLTTRTGGGTAAAIAEYLLRGPKGKGWRRAEVARFELPPRSDARLVPIPAGFEVTSGAGTRLGVLSLETDLSAYRDRAAASPPTGGR